MNDLSETDKRDLEAMKRLKPIAAKAKKLYADTSTSEELANVMEEMIKALSPSLLLRACDSHRTMIIAKRAVKLAESKQKAEEGKNAA